MFSLIYICVLTIIFNLSNLNLGPVLKMCERKEESFVCLLAPVEDIYSAVKLSRYIRSYWILLDEFCRVLIHPKSSYRSGKISDDLPLYESQLRIDMRYWHYVFVVCLSILLSVVYLSYSQW